MIYCTVYAIFLYYDGDGMKCDSINFMLLFFWDGLVFTIFFMEFINIGPVYIRWWLGVEWVVTKA